jgi:hypothetical protein
MYSNSPSSVVYPCNGKIGSKNALCPDSFHSSGLLNPSFTNEWMDRKKEANKLASKQSRSPPSVFPGRDVWKHCLCLETSVRENHCSWSYAIPRQKLNTMWMNFLFPKLTPVLSYFGGGGVWSIFSRHHCTYCSRYVVYTSVSQFVNAWTWWLVEHTSDWTR